MSAGGPTAILIGPMAVGKSSVGRELARRLEEPFADLDALIVERDGRSIPEIFSQDGEAAFRDLEAAVLAEALASRTGVLALGGGAPLRQESAQRLRGRPVVLLEIDEEAVADRVRRSRGRPLLEGPDALERWRSITAARMSAYRDLARWTVSSGRVPPGAVARRIHELIREETP